MVRTRIRAYQDRIDNHGWRIRRIHPGNPERTRYHVASPWALTGVVAFGVGVTLELVWPGIPGLLPHSGLFLALGGLIFALLGLAGTARARRKHWVVVSARLVDRELALAAGPKGRAWCWRLLCRYERDGDSHEVTPEVTRIRRVVRGKRAIEAGRARAVEFLEGCLIGEDEVALYVDPDEPLRCELARGDLQDRLVFGLARLRAFEAANGIRRGGYKLSEAPPPAG